MILVCGEALIDLLVTRQDGELTVKAVAGGSPFNVALGLARLERRVSFAGPLSRDSFGMHLAATLTQSGVALDSALRLDAATTLSVVSSGADGTVDYAFHGEGCADRLMLPEHLPTSLDGVACVTVGSYSLAVEPSGTTYEQFAAMAAAGDRVVSFDPNVRPSLIGDRSAWRDRFWRLLASSTIVKASEEDIRHAFGPQLSLTDLARSWRSHGPSLVVITRGSEAALATGPFGTVEIASRPTHFVDAVGAGDSFHAGLLAALDQRGLLTPVALSSLSIDIAGDVLGFAATAAAITCSHSGADLPYLRDLAAL